VLITCHTCASIVSCSCDFCALTYLCVCLSHLARCRQTRGVGTVHWMSVIHIRSISVRYRSYMHCASKAIRLVRSVRNLKCLGSCQVATDRTKSLRFALIIHWSRQSWAILSFKPSELVRQCPIKISIWKIIVRFGPHRQQSDILGNRKKTTPVTPSLKPDETRVAVE
jgi:hypothetical protein